jgi:hypothetical protein
MVLSSSPQIDVEGSGQMSFLLVIEGQDNLSIE